MAEREIRYCTTSDGVSIAFVAAGDGPPLISMPVPGFSHAELSWQMFGMVQDPLAATYSYVTYDSRGSGLSDRSAIDFSMEAMLRDLDAVVDRSGFDTFALLAFISAAPVAIKYAVTHPDRVTHLILADGWSEFTPIAVSPAYLAGKPLLDVDWTVFTETFGQVLWAFDNPEFGRLFAAFMREASDPEAMRAIWKAWETYDVTDLVPQIAAPTLIIQNKNSRWFTVDIGRRLAGAIPNARLALIDDITYGTVPGLINEFLGVAGATTPADTPGGLVTILFTDMAGSTALTQQLGDERAQDHVRQHNTVVRDALKAHAGKEIKHTGDGIMASFASARGAVDCAIAIQRALADDDGLRICIGLNAGEPVAEEQDLYGTSVQLAARVCAEADGGEILVSNVVRELAAGKGFLFNDRGDRALKGFEDPVKLYEVRWRE
jgi:class 3 adenylate cyclase